MTDIHTHILPGIDDGAADIYDTLDMLAIAAEGGTSTIVATPHANLRGYYDNYYDEHYRELLQTVREAARREQLPITILPGMEVYATSDLLRQLDRGGLITLNGSRYLLLEFDFGIEPDRAEELLRLVTGRGLVPVVAHAERYECVMEEPEVVRRWRSTGAAIQINSGSLAGLFGRRVRHTAYALMDRRYPDVIASDAHSPRGRNPYLADAWEVLPEEYPREYIYALLKKNPRAIVENRALTDGSA